jgi:hypothetical protein
MPIFLRWSAQVGEAEAPIPIGESTKAVTPIKVFQGVVRLMSETVPQVPGAASTLVIGLQVPGADFQIVRAPGLFALVVRLIRVMVGAAEVEAIMLVSSQFGQLNRGTQLLRHSLANRIRLSTRLPARSGRHFLLGRR